MHHTAMSDSTVCIILPRSQTARCAKQTYVELTLIVKMVCKVDTELTLIVKIVCTVDTELTLIVKMVCKADTELTLFVKMVCKADTELTLIIKMVENLVHILKIGIPL